MSFSVNLYTITDDPIVVNKSIPETYITVTLDPIGDIDELNPYFELEYSDSYDDINYAHISKFGRYYFVKKILLPKNRYGFQLTVDVLKSNETNILGLNTTIVRTGGIKKPTYVQDALLPIEPSRQYCRVYRFSSSPHAGYDGSQHHTYKHLVLHTI